MGRDLQGETSKLVDVTILSPSQFPPDTVGTTLIGAATRNCGEGNTGDVRHRQIFNAHDGVLQPLGKVQPNYMLDVPSVPLLDHRFRAHLEQTVSICRS